MQNHAHTSFATAVIRARVSPDRRALFIKNSNTTLYWWTSLSSSTSSIPVRCSNATKSLRGYSMDLVKS